MQRDLFFFSFFARFSFSHERIWLAADKIPMPTRHIPKKGTHTSRVKKKKEAMITITIRVYEAGVKNCRNGFSSNMHSVQ